MKKKPQNAHDQTFDLLMGHQAFACGFIKRYLPESMAQQVDWSSLKLEQLDGRHINANLWKKTQADIVYSASIDNDLGFFWLHIEHQSTPDKLMPLRLLNYQTGLLLNYAHLQGLKKVPVLISLLYYHGTPSPYPDSLDWKDCFDDPKTARQYAGKPILIDMGQQSDADICAESPDTAGAELAFKYIGSSDFSPYAERVLRSLKTAPSEIRHITIEYLRYRANMPDEEILEASLRHLPEDEEKIMQIYQENQQKYIRQGMERGLLQGMEKGKLEGMEKGIKKGLIQGMEKGIKKGLIQGMEKGVLQGMEERNKEIAINMIHIGQSVGTVAKVTGLPESVLKKLKLKSRPSRH